MNDVCTYLIRLSGHAVESEINAMSPLAVTVERVEQAATVLAACSDQAGLIGLLRHLHGLGFVFLAISRSEQP